MANPNVYDPQGSQYSIFNNRPRPSDVYLTTPGGKFEFNPNELVPWQLYRSAGNLLNETTARIGREVNPFSINPYAESPARGRILETLDALNQMRERTPAMSFGGEGVRQLPSPFLEARNPALSMLAMQEPRRVNALLDTLAKQYALSAALLGERYGLVGRARGMETQYKKGQKELFSSIPLLGNLISSAI